MRKTLLWYLHADSLNCKLQLALIRFKLRVFGQRRQTCRSLNYNCPNPKENTYLQSILNGKTLQKSEIANIREIV